jgi:hypothetical protein
LIRESRARRAGASAGSHASTASPGAEAITTCSSMLFSGLDLLLRHAHDTNERNCSDGRTVAPGRLQRQESNSEARGPLTVFTSSKNAPLRERWKE